MNRWLLLEVHLAAVAIACFAIDVFATVDQLKLARYSIDLIGGTGAYLLSMAAIRQSPRKRHLLRSPGGNNRVARTLGTVVHDSW